MAKHRQAYVMAENPQPEDTVCIRAYIPNDARYIAAFWGSYEYLTTWLAWESDDTHRGKDAADVFKTAFIRARDEWIDNCGGCGLYDVRQSTAELCVLEKQSDCDGVWVPFADLSLCKFDVAPPAQAEELDQLLDILMAYRVLLDTLVSGLNSGQTASALKIQYAPLSQLWPKLPDVIDSMADLTEEQRNDALDSVDWQNAALSWWCNDVCDVQSYGAFENVTAWMMCVTQQMLDWAGGEVGDVADWTEEVLSDLTNAAGLGWIVQALPGLHSEFEFGIPQCAEWYHVFDFRTGLHGWTIDDENGQVGGVYVSGSGIQGVYEGVLGWSGAFRVLMHIDVGSVVGVVSGGYSVQYDANENYYSHRTYRAWNDGVMTASFFYDGVYDPPGPLHPNGWQQNDASGNANRIELRLRRIRYDESQPEQGEQGGIMLSRAVLWGTGTDPFA